MVRTTAAKAAAKAPAVDPTVDDATDPVVEQLADGLTLDDPTVHTRVTDFGEGASVTVSVTDPPTAEAAARGQCVVDDGTPHMGRAVNGKVCSAHAMRYTSDGRPRAAVDRRAVQ